MLKQYLKSKSKKQWDAIIHASALGNADSPVVWVS
jgi:hypothetical protein